MNTNTDRTNTVQELKQQVMNDINKVKQDITDIQHRLTPGQLIDEAIYYKRGGGDPSFTFQHMKHNPVGSAFLVLGTILLMENDSQSSMESLVGQKISATRTKLTDAAHSMKTKVGQVQDNLKSKIPHSDDMAINTAMASDVTGTAKQKVKETMNTVTDSLHGVQDRIHGVQDKLHGVQDRIAGATHTISEKSQALMGQARNIDPMVYMAMGLGLGIFTGAAIPISGAEDSVLHGKVGQIFSQFTEEMDDTLNQTVNSFKNEFLGNLTDMNISFFH